MIKILKKETELAAKSINKRWKLHCVVLDIYKYSFKGMNACFTVESHGDGGKWKHVSVTKKRGILSVEPNWDDMVLLKNDFIGPESTAVQILPPEVEWVNLHAHCFHLWSYLDGKLWPIG